MNEEQNERKNKGKEPLVIEPFVESNRELEKTSTNYVNTNEQKNMVTKKPRKQLTQICEVCFKIDKCRRLPRHMWESHKIGDPANFQYPCKTVWNCGKTFTRAQAKTAHE